MSTRRPLHLVFVLALTACFESGPLGSKTSGLEEATPDTDEPDTAPDTTEADTAVTDPDTTPDVLPDTVDTIDMTDTPDTDVDDTTVAPDVPPLRSCLTQSDCHGLAGADLCAGPIRCVDYGCRPDPSAAVVCDDSDPCVANSCNPSNGLCESRSLCSCESPVVLPCGPPATWPTDSAGVRPAFPDYGTCPSGSAAHVRILQFSASGRVRLESVAGIARFWLLDADVCDGGACLGGHTASLLFNADPTKTYAIAVEETGAASATMTATCSLTVEDRCNNGIDDDGDGLTDCDDRDCDNRDGCVRPPDNEVGLCSDGIDNDNDGFTDCADLDCDSAPACLQACEIPSNTIGCNFSQGLGTGGGKTRSTNYSCNPTPQAGKEVVYRFRPNVSGTVRVGFANSAGLTLHILRETGRGCTPRDCIAMATGDVWFDAQADAIYYAVVDAPAGVTGSFNISFDCSPFD